MRDRPHARGPAPRPAPLLSPRAIRGRERWCERSSHDDGATGATSMPSGNVHPQAAPRCRGRRRVVSSPGPPLFRASGDMKPSFPVGQQNSEETPCSHAQKRRRLKSLPFLHHTKDIREHSMITSGRFDIFPYAGPPPPHYTAAFCKSPQRMRTGRALRISRATDGVIRLRQFLAKKP